jgi:hypothetical protein
MQLLAYAYNRAAGGPVVGIAVGEDPEPELPQQPVLIGAEDAAITSFVELRVSADHPDPATALQLLTMKAFARRARLGPDEPILQVPAGAEDPGFHDASIRLQIGPGFEHPWAIYAALQPLLSLCRVRDASVTTAAL